VITVWDLEGVSMVTVNPRSQASEQMESLHISPYYSKRVSYITANQRGAESNDFKRGEYVVCVNAIVQSSVLIDIAENNNYNSYKTVDDVMYLFSIEGKGTIEVNFVGRFAKGEESQLNILAEVEEQTGVSLDNVKLGYRVCESTSESSCQLTDDELAFKKMSLMKDTTSLQTYGSIKHPDSDYCTSRETCIYEFAIYNPNDERILVNFKGDSLSVFNQEITEGTWYANGRRAGETIYYKFDTKDYDYANIHAIEIVLESLNGDADLFVSTTNRGPSP
jgi:hypothetical protein